MSLETRLETLESQIETQTVVIQDLTAAILALTEKMSSAPATSPVSVVASPAARPQKPEPAKAKAPAETKTYSVEDVRSALVALAKRHGNDASKQLLFGIGGVWNTPRLERSKYAAVINAAKNYDEGAA